jgi:uncharacterized cofD-like protein
LTGLMELTGDPVVALDHARELVRAVGRVLPMSTYPLAIEAVVRGDDPARPDELTVVRGQHAIAISRGAVENVRLTPIAPVACPEAVAAVESADWLVFGPGSWFTSVIPHLLVPDLAGAIAASQARRLVTLNLAAELETAGLSLPDHLRALARYLPGLRVDVVLADGKAVGDPIGLQSAAESLRARVVFAPVAVPDGGARHDPVALASALYEVLRMEFSHVAGRDVAESSHVAGREIVESSHVAGRKIAESPDRPSTEQGRRRIGTEDGPKGQDSNARC